MRSWPTIISDPLRRSVRRLRDLTLIDGNPAMMRIDSAALAVYTRMGLKHFLTADINHMKIEV